MQGSLFIMMFHFFYSRYKEELALIQTFQEEDPLGVLNRAKQIQFPCELALSIHNDIPDKWRSKLKKNICADFQVNKDGINKAILFFERYWKRYEPFWMTGIENFFGYKIPSYYVLLSQYRMGISDWYGNSIVIPAMIGKSRFYIQIYILLCEVILSQIFISIRKKYDEDTLTDFNVWKIAELASFVILHKIHPVFQRIKKTGYHDVDVLLEKGFSAYQESVNLTQFLQKLIVHIRNNDVI